jgi:hypothetical protein
VELIEEVVGERHRHRQHRRCLCHGRGC